MSQHVDDEAEKKVFIPIILGQSQYF